MAVWRQPDADGFLVELMNRGGSDRMALLRLETQVEKFMNDPAASEYVFPGPMSSYQRMMCHKVAQHYGCETLSEDGVSVLARKTAACEQGVTPLSMLSPDEGSDQAEPSQARAPKVIVPSKHGEEVDEGAGKSGSAKAGSEFQGHGGEKSAQEREKEYEQAKERIFNSARSSNTTRQSPTPRKAIMRDFESERHDPDFDRSLECYASRFDPSSQPSPSALYAPPTDFPALATPPPWPTAAPSQYPPPPQAFSAVQFPSAPVQRSSHMQDLRQLRRGWHSHQYRGAC